MNASFLFSEPGYYEDGKFGIRIEDIVLVVPTETKYKFGNHKFLGFQTVSLVPIQTKLLDSSLLTADEVSIVVFVVPFLVYFVYTAPLLPVLPGKTYLQVCTGNLLGVVGISKTDIFRQFEFKGCEGVFFYLFSF